MTDIVGEDSSDTFEFRDPPLLANKLDRFLLGSIESFSSMASKDQFKEIGDCIII